MISPLIKPAASESSLKTTDMLLNMGPSHPAMHGIIRLILNLDGEVIKDCDVEIGYLHRAFEKMSEQGGYLQVVPYTDRLNYVSPLINNIGYCMAVEKLFQLKTTERCDYIRVIMSEISRVCDHLTCIGASAMEVGAFTVFLYMIKAREYLWELVESVTGARLTISYTRIGGVKGDLPEDFIPRCADRIKEVRKVIKECHVLLTKNRIFIDRMKGIGVLSKEDAVAYSITGPFLRASGIDYDVRKDCPYLVYDRLDFDVPIGEMGDNYDRYLVRMEEMEQSLRIVEQCFHQMPKGPVAVDMGGRVIPAEFLVDESKMGRTDGTLEASVSMDPTLDGSSRAQFDSVETAEKRAIFPAKEDLYGNIEGMMQHFKLVMMGHGIRPPQGDAYVAVEGGNGELGFYIVSDGSDKPYRVRVRPPCFTIMAALPILLKGWTIADIVPTFGSVNMIGGELDR